MDQDKTVDIGTLIPDDHNFNRGTEEGARLMQKSFEQFGAGRSVLVDKDNRIIAGNKSTKAAAESGIKRVRIIETDGTELIAVKRTDITLDSKEGRELALADNATTQVNLAWDQAELESMQEEYGFDANDWGTLVPDIASAQEENEAEEDDFDEENDVIETICQPNDLWQLGEHLLLCGDSTSTECCKRLMGGGLADLWLTDPPYNVAVSNSQGMTIMNDSMAKQDFRKFLIEAFASAKTILTDGCPFYIWLSSSEYSNFEGALNDVGLQVHQQLIWNKNHFNLGRAHYQWKHEPCLYGWKGDACRYFIDFRNRTTVIEDEAELNFEQMKKSDLLALLRRIYQERTPTTVINENKPTINKDHPTMKPVRLFGYLITNSTRPGDIVLDTFGGSGTTIVACEQLKRKARLMELDPHYCDVIIARWEKLTGNKAEKIE